MGQLMEEILIICLLIAVFLIILNGFLYGALKNRIDAILSVTLLCVLAALFYWFSWKGLGTGVALAIIAASFLHPLARRIAAFLLAHPPKT